MSLNVICNIIKVNDLRVPPGNHLDKLAQDIGVSPRRINEIIHGKRSITADTALRLARYFQMSPQFWMGLQMDYELDLEKDRLTDILARDVKIMPMKKCA
ncbi:MAG: hypothetical protein ACD_35C00269G0002 [uncultured bacterium]|nr:MAG: hypothetical protein ACD_35C00269G0002 [uncultured bacterium]